MYTIHAVGRVKAENKAQWVAVQVHGGNFHLTTFIFTFKTKKSVMYVELSRKLMYVWKFGRKSMCTGEK